MKWLIYNWKAALRSMNKFLARLFLIVVELENVYEEVNKETKNKDSELSIKGASKIMPISKLNINKKIAFVVFKKTLKLLHHKKKDYLFNISRYQFSD